MRMTPIEKPTGFKLRILYSVMRKQLGKTPTPFKVLSARMPSSIKVTTVMYKVEKKIGMNEETKFLIQYFTSLLNGCTFCMDIGKAFAVKSHYGLDKFNEIVQYGTSNLFSEQEKSVLSYIEEIIRNRHVSDETFNNLKRYFNEKEIIEITYLMAVQTFTNLSNIALGIESDGLCEIALQSLKTVKAKEKGIEAR